jgi:hypothetical protein
MTLGCGGPTEPVAPRLPFVEHVEINGLVFTAVTIDEPQGEELFRVAMEASNLTEELASVEYLYLELQLYDETEFVFGIPAPSRRIHQVFIKPGESRRAITISGIYLPAGETTPIPGGTYDVVLHLSFLEFGTVFLTAGQVTF